MAESDKDIFKQANVLCLYTLLIILLSAATGYGIASENIELRLMQAEREGYYKAREMKPKCNNLVYKTDDVEISICMKGKGK